jgi:succinate dehydrogenase / fumarate reductase cytochrome b subunit
VNILQTGWLRTASVILAWSVFHHLFSGIRFLFIDMDAGARLPQARRNAWLVNIAGLLATLAFAGWLL